MPLSEFLLKAAKSKSTAAQSKMNNFSSGQFSMPDHEFSELLWENGQIIMHDHSSRSRRSFPTAYTDRDQERDNGDAINPKNAQLSAIDLFGNEFPTAQDDDIVPWISTPIDESLCPDPLQNDFCSDFLEEFAHANPNNLTNHANKTGDLLGQEVRNIQTAEHEHTPKAPAKRSDSGISKTQNLFQPARHCPTSVADTYTRVLESGTGCSNNAQLGVELAATRLDKQNAIAPRPPQPKASTSANLMNFSLFSRPAAVAKSNLEIADRTRNGEKVLGPVASNHIESNLESVSVVKSIARSQGPASGLSNFNLKPFEKPLHAVVPRNRLETICDVDAPIEDDNIAKGGSTTARTVLTRLESEMAPEAVVASSSVCLVSSTAVQSDDSKRGEKRRVHELEDSSGNPSEDFDDELAGRKKLALARGQCSKRSRAVEVHNLSERRRRERINEKMRALQELIPNCNKADKASMLEDAIEYIKTLQLHVQSMQIMSMGGGLHMPLMLLPPGMQQMRAPPMVHFSPMGVGMGMGMGMGYGMGVYDLNATPGCPVIPVPAMHGTQLPCPPICGPSLLPRMIRTSNPPMFGAPGQSCPASLSMPAQPGSSTDLIGKMSSVPEFTAPVASPAPSFGATVPSSDQKQETQKLEASKQD